MTGGKGLDRKGNNGGRPLDSNPRSELGKSANAPKKDIVIVTNAEGVAQRMITVQAGSSGGAIVVSSPARSKVSATPPQQQQQQSAEFKRPDSTSKPSSSAKSSTSKAASSGKGPANIVRPSGLVYVDSRSKSSQLKPTVKTEQVSPSSLGAVEAVLSSMSSLADEGDFQSDVKPEPTYHTRAKFSSRRSSAAPLSAAPSTAFQLSDTSTAFSSPVLQQHAPTRHHAPSAGSFDYPSQSASVQHQQHQRPQHIHRPQAHAAPARLASFAELTARSLGVTQQPPAVGYYDGSRQAQSEVASGSQRQMFVHPTHHQQQSAPHQQQPESMDTDTLLINVHPSRFDFGIQSSSTASLGGVQPSSSASLGGDGDADPELAAITRMMAEANERLIQLTASRQQAQVQHHQFPAPLPTYNAPASLDQSCSVSAVDDYVAEMKQKNPQYFEGLPKADDLVFEYLKEGNGSEQGESDGGDLLSQTSPEIPAELDMTDTHRRTSGIRLTTNPPNGHFRNPNDRLTIDNLHTLARQQDTSVRLLLSERSHVGAVARQQVKHVIKQPDGSFVRGDSQFGGIESALASEETQKARQHDKEQQRAVDRLRSSRKRKIGQQQPSPPDHTLRRQIKTEEPDDGDLMTTADALAEPFEHASAHSESDAGDSDGDGNSEYGPGAKRPKRSASSVASSSVQGDDVAGSSKRKRAPVYKDGDLDANKQLVFTNNKFADEEYSDCEAGLEDWPDHISRGKPPSGGAFPTLHLTHNTNYATAQMYELVGHSKAEIKKIEDRIRESVEPQLTALQHRRFHVSDPRHRNNEGSRQFASIINDPKTWKLDAPLPPGVHQPPLYSHVQKPKQGVKTKEPWHQTKECMKAAKYRGFKYTFEQSEARHFKGYDQSKKLNPTVICPATTLQAIPGIPSFYRLIHTAAKIPEAFKIVDCTHEVISHCFACGPTNLRTMTLLINGDIEVELLVINGKKETEEAARKRVDKEIKKMLTSHADDLPQITLSDNLKFLVWKKDAPVNLVHRDIWPWLEHCCNHHQIFARYCDLPFDVTSEDQIGMCFDTTNRHSLLSFTLGLGSEYALPYSNIALNAGVVIHAGANPARLPSHHYCSSGAFVEYLLGDEKEVVKRMKAGPYKKEFETCARYDMHRGEYLFNPDILGLKYVMGIRRPGQMTTVLGGGFRLCLSFGAAESIGVDWLSAPASWLVIEKPLVSAGHCRENAKYSYVEKRIEWFEGAFNACTTMQDPRAKLFRDTINSCYGCLQEPDPYVDAETWRTNHTRPFKTGTTPRGNTCTNPIGHFPKSKRELLALVAGLKPIKTEAQDSDDENAPEHNESAGEQVANEGEQEGAKEPVDGAPGVDARPTEQQEAKGPVDVGAIKKEPTDQDSGLKAEATPPLKTDKKKKTPAKDSKAKGQEKEEQPSKADQSADVVFDLTTDKPESSGVAPNPTPPLTKKQQQAKKVKQEKTMKPDAAASIGEYETSGDDKLAIAMDAEDGGSDPSKVKRDGDLQSEDAKVVTEPIVSDLQMDEKGEQSPAADGGEESSEAEFITDDDSDQEVPAAEKTGKGSEADSDVGDPPIAQPAVSVGDGSGGGDPDEEMEEIEADEEDEEADDEEDEEMDDQE